MVNDNCRRLSISSVNLENSVEVYLMPTIQYSENTVGCRIGDEIWVHPKLYTEPELYHAIVGHERKHTKGFSVKDITLDIVNDDLEGHKKAYWKFMFKNPKTFLGLLPISKIGPHWTLDGTMLGFSILAAALVWFLLASLL